MLQWAVLPVNTEEQVATDTAAAITAKDSDARCSWFFSKPSLNIVFDFLLSLYWEAGRGKHPFY